VVKRCIAIWRSSIDVGMSIKKDLDALMTTIRRCNMKRRTAILINGIDIGISIKEDLDALMMTIR